MHNTQSEPESSQEQDPLGANTGETLDILDVYSDPDPRQQLTHQEGSQEQDPEVNICR